SGAASIYVDGALDTGNPNSGAWSMPASQPIELGFTSGGTYRAYDGLLDDVRVYNRQLTSGEITSLYNTGALIDTNALQMQLTFATPPVPGISLSWQATNAILLSATGTNLSSAVVVGTYTNVPAATSPYYVIPKSSQRYFRYRIPNAPRSLVSNPYLM